MIHSSSQTVSVPKNVGCWKYVYTYPSPAFDQRFAHLSISPTDVIKGWVLCHHLGLVVRSIVFAACDEPARARTLLQRTEGRLMHLEQAEYYLARELDRLPRCTLIPMEPYPLTTKQVIRDWKLSFHLGETLFYIKTSLSSYRRKEALERALKHLREEIQMTKGTSNHFNETEINHG